MGVITDLVLSERSILYVEDERDVRENITEYLNTFFKEVYVATNGEEALNLYHQKHPDVALLDVNIPLKDGLAVAKEIRKVDKDIRLIILTAYKDEERLLSAIELGLSKYLVKPIDPDAFQQAFIDIAQELQKSSKTIIHLRDNYYYNIQSCQFYHEENIIPLSIKEGKLLNLLVNSFGKTVTNETIMAYVWEENYELEISQNSVKSLVNNLRKNLYKDAISNVYGTGYVLK